MNFIKSAFVLGLVGFAGIAFGYPTMVPVTYVDVRPVYVQPAQTYFVQTVTPAYPVYAVAPRRVRPAKRRFKRSRPVYVTQPMYFDGGFSRGDFGFSFNFGF